MRKRTVIWVFMFTFCVFAGMANAGEPVITANDRFGVDAGEEFDVVIFVECHEDVANYTVRVTLHPRFEFVEEDSDMVVSGSNASITHMGYDQDSLRFEFPMVATNDTPEGDYHIPYSVYRNGSETNFILTLEESDTVRISIGEGGGENPCSSTSFLILPVFAVGCAFCIVKKQRW